VDVEFSLGFAGWEPLYGADGKPMCDKFPAPYIKLYGIALTQKKEIQVSLYLSAK
jgi:hypothetical protein